MIVQEYEEDSLLPQFNSVGVKCNNGVYVSVSELNIQIDQDATIAIVSNTYNHDVDIIISPNGSVEVGNYSYTNNTSNDITGIIHANSLTVDIDVAGETVRIEP